MWVLIISLVFFGLVLMLVTSLNRRRSDEETEIVINNDGECCGAHEVCDKDSLLSASVEAEYFDDEELDVLSNIDPEKYSENQVSQISEVFYTLKENEVAAWLRSLQIRNIQLPVQLRDEALMIVSERRGA